MNSMLQRLGFWFSRYAADPQDSGELRLRKIIGISVIVSAIGTFSLYGLIYFAYDEWKACLVTIEGAAASVLLLASYRLNRHYVLHWNLFMVNMVLTLTLVHLLLGGFKHGGMVGIWLLTVPLLTMVADNSRRGLAWALLVFAVIIAAAFADHLVSRPNNLSQAFLTVFNALNLLGFASYMLLAVFYYIWRIDVIGNLVVEEREARMRQVEEASRHKSEFLANMSHELRTPLNAVMGFSEALDERYFGDLNEKQAEYVKDIHSSGRHLLSLVNDILDLSKVEAGRMELELSEFDLPAALADALALIKERAHRHNLDLRLECRPESFSIEADERKLKQIMLNLLSNAVKFTPDNGSITIAARMDDTLAEISVTDTGAGIAQEDLAAVFEEFRQVGSDTARKAEGTGLGLPLAKRFVELHGGTISLHSKLGQGSSFVFALPIRRSVACVASASAGTTLRAADLRETLGTPESDKAI